jgi:hypothetical protein
MAQQIRIQITTLNDDGSATLASWPISAEDAELYMVMLTDDLEFDPDESVYTVAGVDAIDEAASGPGYIVAL